MKRIGVLALTSEGKFTFKKSTPFGSPVSKVHPATSSAIFNKSLYLVEYSSLVGAFSSGTTRENAIAGIPRIAACMAAATVPLAKTTCTLMLSPVFIPAMTTLGLFLRKILFTPRETQSAGLPEIT